MTFPYKLIDLTHTLEASIPTWDGGCGYNHDLHLDYADCESGDKFRVMKMSNDLAKHSRLGLDGVKRPFKPKIEKFIKTHHQLRHSRQGNVVHIV
jgi:hypothetical protein